MQRTPSQSWTHRLVGAVAAPDMVPPRLPLTEVIALMGRNPPAYCNGGYWLNHRIDPGKYCWSGLLEVDALDHRQALEVAAQAIQAQFDGPEPYPIPTSEDARTSEADVALGRDRNPDGAAEIDAIG